MSEEFERLAKSEQKARDLLVRAENAIRYGGIDAMHVADDISEFLWGGVPKYSPTGRGGQTREDPGD